jgi:hypothetical protein
MELLDGETLAVRPDCAGSMAKLEYDGGDVLLRRT